MHHFKEVEMNKLESAQRFAEIMLEHLYRNGSTIDSKEISEKAFILADAMQSEADKRQANTTIASHVESNEWQPDWSQAPKGFNRFVVGSDGGYGFFTNMEPKLQGTFWFVGSDGIAIKDHGYKGNWQDSLRKRPQ